MSETSNNPDIAAIGIANQRETTVIWNKDTGVPYHNAIVWNDSRTSKICDGLIESGGGKDFLRGKTGLPISPYFSASKVQYLLETVPNLRDDANNGVALFGTVDTWLLWKLTGGRVHVTDVTNASRTLLMNIVTLQWDNDLLALFNIPSTMLPTIRSSSEIFGHIVDEENPSISCGLTGVPVAGVLGDQHAALVGQACFEPGEAKYFRHHHAYLYHC